MKNKPRGLTVGRTIKFGVADGYAEYTIREIRQREVVVDLDPNGDGYTFEGAYENENGELVLPRPVVEKRVRFEDEFDQLIGR